MGFILLICQYFKQGWVGKANNLLWMFAQNGIRGLVTQEQLVDRSLIWSSSWCCEVCPITSKYYKVNVMVDLCLPSNISFLL